MANDCHDDKGMFCEGGGSGSGSGTSRPSQGIQRVGKEWKTADGQALPAHLQGLKIPPAWTNVQVNPDPEGSLLVTGNDAKGRLQYVYSAKFMDTQKAAKFERINALDKEFDEIKSQNDANRADPGKAEEADCLHVIMETGIRPGSDRDTKGDVKAFGATTLRGEHVVQTEEGVRLQYVGKKGVSLDIPIDNPSTAEMLVSRAEAAGADGRLFDTDSSTLLQYTHTLGSGSFKTKDFRTLVGTSMAKQEIAKIPVPTTKSGYKKAVSTVAKAVSRKLGNTPSVALKSYIAPEVFDGWSASGMDGAKAHMGASDPLFDFGIMVGTACGLRHKDAGIHVANDPDPEGNDEDIPCPPDVKMALGFDPDELDFGNKSCACEGGVCFFGNAEVIDPVEHTAIIQALDRWIDYPRPTGPQRFFYGVDDFTGSEREWDTVPVVFAQQHPDHKLVERDLGEALARVRTPDGGPGRLVGSVKQSRVQIAGQPRMEAKVEFDDPEVERLHQQGLLALSSAFTAGHDDSGRLTERVRPNHLLVFRQDAKNQPRDPAAMFLNKTEGSDVTDDETKAKTEDKSEAEPEEGSTEVRLKALIADLLKRLDAAFVSANVLSRESKDSGDPSVKAKPDGADPAQKGNMNDCHGDDGKFCEGGGSSGGGKSGGMSDSERERIKGILAKNPNATPAEIWGKSGVSENAFRRRDTLDRGGRPAKSYHEPDSSKVSQTYDWHHDDSIPQKDADLADNLVDRATRGLLINGNDLDNPDAITNAAGKAADAFNAKSETGAGKFSSGDFKKAIETEIRIRAPDGASEDVVETARWGGKPGKGRYDYDNKRFANADLPWDDCIAQQLKRGYSDEQAKKICGYIKAKNNLRREMMDADLSNQSADDGSDSEEDIMGTELDKLKSELDAANQKMTAQTTELDAKKKELDAANQRLAAFEQAQKDTAWANMRDTHVPKGWLAGPDDTAKANKEAEVRKSFETDPVGFANKILDFHKGKTGGQDKSKEEGASFGNKDGADDPLAVTRELHALSGRRR